MREQRVDVGGGVDVQADEVRQRHARLREHGFEIVHGKRELRGDVTIVLGPTILAHRGLPRRCTGCADCPETTSPSMNLISSDQVTGLTAERSIATPIVATVSARLPFAAVLDAHKTSLPTNHDTLCHVFW